MRYTKKDVDNMRVAQAVSCMSKDTSTKVGCVIVASTGEPLSWGFNGLPRGVNDFVVGRYERPLKYKWTEHSERNAIYNAARSGVSLLGSKIYVTSLVPCVDCSRAIVQAGIKEVFVEGTAFHKSNERAKVWLEDWKICSEMFKEAGVKIRTVHMGPIKPHQPTVKCPLRKLIDKIKSWF